MPVGDDLVALILVVDDSAYARRLMRKNLEAAQLVLSPQVLEEIDRLHPPPSRKRPLAMI